MYMHIYIYTYVYMYLYIVCIYVFIYIHVFIYIFMYICVYVISVVNKKSTERTAADYYHYILVSSIDIFYWLGLCVYVYI
jgi:hypothetical protein